MVIRALKEMKQIPNNCCRFFKKKGNALSKLDFLRDSQFPEKKKVWNSNPVYLIISIFGSKGI